jgi:hypothetical protein
MYISTLCTETIFSAISLLLLSNSAKSCTFRKQLYSAETLTSTREAIQEIPRILWNPGVRYRIHRSPLLFRIQRRTNLVHTMHSVHLRFITSFSSHLRVSQVVSFLPGSNCTVPVNTVLIVVFDTWNNNNSFILTFPATVFVAFFGQRPSLLTGLVDLYLLHGCTDN